MRRNRPLLTVVFVLLAVLTGLLGFVGAQASRLVYPARIMSTRTPADYDISKWEEVTFKTADNLKLSGWFIQPASKANGAALVLIHGLNSIREGMLDQAAMFVHHGYAVLMFDLRAHGRSQGHQTTWGVEEVADVEAAVSFLHKQPGIDPNRIGFVGHSMGGAIAIQAAAVMPEVKVVIVESAYSVFSDNADRLTIAFTRVPHDLAPLVLWQAGQIANINPRSIRPIDEVASISPRPILFIHGELDGTIPVWNSRRLYRAASKPKELYLIPIASHANLFSTDPLKFENRVITFLETYLINPINQSTQSTNKPINQ